jgi:hypothetical protein
MQSLLGEMGIMIHFAHPGRDSGENTGGEAFWPLSWCACVSAQESMRA